MPEIFYEDYQENVARPSMRQMDETLAELNRGITKVPINIDDL